MPVSTMTYSSGQGRSSFGGPRVIIGIIIALVGVVSYFMHTSVNPVTGEKQRIAMTEEQEKALGLQAAPQMAAEMGGEINPSDPRSQFVENLGQKIVANSDASKSPYTFDFHLLADTQTVNAFALPGGQVFITRALYDKLPDEASLAGVLGHEIGHVVGRHAAEHMAKGKLGETLVTATGVATSGDQRGAAATAAAQMVEQMTQLKFSRNDESAADTFGLKFMAQAGYDPRAMLDVMKILEAESKGDRPPQFLVTHPYPEARLEAIDAYLKKNPPTGQLQRGSPLPK